MRASNTPASPTSLELLREDEELREIVSGLVRDACSVVPVPKGAYRARLHAWKRAEIALQRQADKEAVLAVIEQNASNWGNGKDLCDPEELTIAVEALFEGKKGQDNG